MQPNTPYQPPQPVPVVPQSSQPDPQPPQAQPKKRSKRKQLGLILLIAPTTLIVCGFLLFTISNLVQSMSAANTQNTTCQTDSSQSSASAQSSQLFGDSPTQSASSCAQQPFGQPSTVQTVLNIFSFIFEGLGILLWLPSLIIGIVLLATKPRVQPTQ